MFRPTVSFETENTKEIARICLASHLGDAYRIMVTKTESGYDIEIIDDYETQFIDYTNHYELMPTQEEIFDVICEMNTEKDSNYFWMQIVELHEFQSINEISEFIHIESNFYPDLNNLFILWFKENGY